MKKNSNRGFTLIELLVVIAIIGILASVVLASLGTARTKGKVASAQGSLSSMRAQAELSVGSDGKYVTGLCASSGTGGLKPLVDAVSAQLTASLVKCGQNTNLDAWAAEGQISSSPTQFYCVDSTGNATTTAATSIITGTGSSDVTCG